MRKSNHLLLTPGCSDLTGCFFDKPILTGAADGLATEPGDGRGVLPSPELAANK